VFDRKDIACYGVGCVLLMIITEVLDSIE